MKVLSVIWSGRIPMMWKRGLSVLVEQVRYLYSIIVYMIQTTNSCASLGWLFGDRVADEFCHVNDLSLIARAHQLVNEGYKYHFTNQNVVTVWSAPNYCYRCGNLASVCEIGEDLKPTFKLFSAVSDDQRHMPTSRPGRSEYFL